MRFPDYYPPDEPMPLPEPPKVDDETAADMAALGITFDDVLKGYRAHREQQAIFDSDVKFAAHMEDTRSTATDPLMPPTVTGFHDAVMAARQPANKAYLDSIPLSHRETYARDWQATEKNLSQILAKGEYEARGQYERDQINKTVDRNVAFAADNPLHTDALIHLVGRHIDNASSIESDDKTALKADAEIKLRTAQLVALHGHDADEMRRQLGVADPIAAAEAARSGAPATPATETEAAIPGVTVTSAPVAAPSADVTVGVARPAGTTTPADSGPFGPVRPAAAIDDPTPATEAPSPDDPAATTTEGPSNPVGAAANSLKLSANSTSAAAPKLGSATPAAAEPANPLWARIPQSARPGLVNEATVRQAAAQGAARIDLEDRLDSIKKDLTSTGTTSRPLPTGQDFAVAYGLLDATPKYNGFQDIVKIGAAIDSIKTLNQGQLTGLVASRAQLAASGKAAADDLKTLLTAAAINQQKRLEDPAGYTGSTFGIDPVGFTSQDSATLKRSIAAQKLHQDQLGISVEAQKLLPKTIARQTVDTFNNGQLSPEQRIGDVLKLLKAAPNPQARAIVVRQLVEAGLPDTVASAVRAFNRGQDDPDAQDAAVRLLKAATQRGASTQRLSLGDLHLASGGMGAMIEAKLREMGIPALQYGTEIPTNFKERQARLGRSRSFQQLDRDFRLIASDAQNRLKGDENLDEAVTHAMIDLYGPVKRIQGSYFDAIVNQVDDEDRITKGAYALLPKIEEQQRQLQAITPQEPGAPIGRSDPATIAYDGYFRNAPGGKMTNDFIFIDRSTGRPIEADDGEPLIFSRAEIIQAGEIADRTITTMPGPRARPVPVTLSEALHSKYKSKERDWADLAATAMIQLGTAASGAGELEAAAGGTLAAVEGVEDLLAGGAALRAGETAVEGEALVTGVGNAAEIGIDGFSEGLDVGSKNAVVTKGAEVGTEAAASEPLVGYADNEPLNASDVLKGFLNTDGSPNFTKAADHLSNRIKVTIRNRGQAEIYPGNEAVDIVDVEPTGELVDANGGKWNALDLVKKDNRSASVVNLRPAQDGGLHEDLEPWDGYERHHMPSNNTSPYAKARGPAIAMLKEDHYLTRSWGRRKTGDALRVAE